MPSAVVIIRIYFNSLHETRSLWAKISQPPTAVRLADEALRQGIQYALATVGTTGFVRGARTVEGPCVEGVSQRLPSCVELVGTPEQISRFLSAQRAILENALVVKMTGTELLAGDSLAASASATVV